VIRPYSKRAIVGKLVVRVGDWPLATGRIMPELLRAYQQAMPNVHVKLHDWTVDKNIAGVRDGRLHLAITIPPLKRNALADLRFQEIAVVIGIITRKEKLSPAAEKFCQCAREAFSALR
jgi:DNA-binding transcriptional LysR family regulator